MPQQRLTIFISSTSEDLKEHRRKVIDLLLSAEYLPIAMEHFPAGSAHSLAECFKRIKGCDLLVGFYGWRYGSTPHGRKRSFTERELDYAREEEKDCLCFVIDETFSPRPPDEPGQKEASRPLEKFKKKVRKLRKTESFTTPDDLAAKVLVAVQTWEREHSPSAAEPVLTPRRRKLLNLLETVEKRCRGALDRAPKPVESTRLEWRNRRKGPLSSQQWQPLPAGGLPVLLEERDRLVLIGPQEEKTLELVHLARDLAASLPHPPDPPPPVPVAFSLSNWEAGDQTFADWLVQQLSDDYTLTVKEARDFVESCGVVPLLDDLDDVPPGERPRCLSALGEHLADFGGRLVVAERLEAYPDLGPVPHVDVEVMVGPLSSATSDPAAVDLGAAPGLSSGQTRRALAWFARGMIKHRLSRFELERLEPAWLGTPALRGLYALLSRGTGGVALAVPFAAVFGHLLFFLAAGLASGLLVGVVDSLPVWRSPVSGQARDALLQTLARIGIITAGVLAILMGIVHFRHWKDDFYLLSCAVALIFGAVFGPRPGGAREDIRILEDVAVGWSWKGAIVGAAVAGFATLVLGLLSRLLPVGTASTMHTFSWLILAGCIGLLGSAMGGLGTGLEGSFLRVRRRPGLDLRQIARHGVRVGLGAAGTVTPLLGLLLAALEVKSYADLGETQFGWGGVVAVPLLGLVAGFYFAWAYIGLDLVQHWTLRLLLSLTTPMPFRWRRFLHHAVDRSVLCETDGAFEFSSRLLRDWFAEADQRNAGALRNTSA